MCHYTQPFSLVLYEAEPQYLSPQALGRNCLCVYFVIVGMAGWPASLRSLPVSASLTLQLQVLATIPGVLLFSEGSGDQTQAHILVRHVFYQLSCLPSP